MTNSSQYVIDILKQKFEHEVTRRSIYDNVLNLPIAILSFVVAGIYFMLQEIKIAYPQTLLFFIIVYITTLIGSTLVTIHWLYKFYFALGSEYKSLPSGDDIMDVYNTSTINEKVVAGYFDEDRSDATIVADLDAFLIQSYTDCVRVNTDINNKREVLFTRAKKSLGFTFLFAVIFYLIIVIVKFSNVGG